MIEKINSTIKSVFDINQSTLSGCVDIIVVEQKDGSLKSTPFHVRFGKLKVLKSNEQIVSLKINDVLQNVQMKMDSTGAAYFEEIREEKYIDKYTQNVLMQSQDNLSDLEIKPYPQSDDENIQNVKVKKEEQNSPTILIDKKQIQQQQQQTKEKKQEKNLMNLFGLFGNKQTDDSQKPKEEQIKKDDQQKEKQKKDEQPKEIQKKDDQINKKEDEKKKQEENLLSQKKIEEGKKITPLPNYKSQQEINEEQKQMNDKKQQKQLDISFQKTTEKIILKDDKYQMDEVIENLEKKKNFLQDLSDKNSPFKTQNNNNFKDMLNSSKDTISTQKNQNIKTQPQQPTHQKNNTSIFQSPSSAKEEGKNAEIKGQNENKKQEDEEEEEEEDDDDEEIGMSLCGNITLKKDQDIDLNEIFESKKVTFEQFIQDPAKILNDKTLLLKIKDHLYPWDVAAVILLSKLCFNQTISDQVLQNLMKSKKKSFLDDLFFWKRTQTKKEHLKINIENPPENPPTKEQKSPLNSPLQDSTQNNNRKMSDDVISLQSEQYSTSTKSRIIKVYKPKSEILKSFNLKRGVNKISYTVTTQLQGSQTVEGHIFLWPSNVQIIISDIDGTITKSDVLGHIMPLVDKDWSHKHVIELYQNCIKNGYKILYLTARAIGQSESTRNFIKNLQQGNRNLPCGPVITSSDRLLPSFKREVIDKKPDVFKIQVLREIQSIFPNQNIYYAGFGNRETDAIAYRSVGISIQKIYIINPAGELYQFNNTYKKSYEKLNQMVDSVFPPLNEQEEIVSEEFNEFNYWSIKPHNIEDIESLLN